MCSQLPFLGAESPMRGGCLWLHHVGAESGCPSGMKTINARKVDSIRLACMVQRVLLCADWMIRQTLCRGNSRRCWSTNTQQTSP